MTGLLVASFLMLRGPAAWVLLETKSEATTEVTSIGGRDFLEAAVSKDGRWFAFTSMEGQTRRLYFSRGLDGAGEQVGPAGYHGAPTFSPDGAWLFFVFTPGPGGGPIGQHVAGQNAQLWRVRLEGEKPANPEPLTTSVGCKGSPQVVSATRVLLAHATCQGAQGLEELSLNEKEKTSRLTSPGPGVFGEPRMSVRGGLLAYTRAYYDSLRIQVSLSGVPSNSDLIVAEVPMDRRVTLGWADDGSFLYFVADGALRKWSPRSKVTSIIKTLIEKAAQ